MSEDIRWLLATLVATMLMAFPYVLDRIAVRGLLGALGNPSPDEKALASWAARAQRAHANAVENLVVFAPAVLALTALGRESEATAMAGLTYLAARIVHYVVYALGIPIVRTLAFFAGWGATAVVLLGAGGVL